MNKMEKDSSKTTGGIRKVETIHSIDELHLDAQIVKKFNDLGASVGDVIHATRTGILHRRYGISAARIQKIEQAVDEAGFIFHESAKSAGVRRLLWAIFRKDSKFGQFETAEEYELQEEFWSYQYDAIAEILGTLTQRETKMLALRYGLDGAGPRTLRAVGDVFRLCQERVRGICEKALRKLRHCSRTRRLRLAFSEHTGAPELLLEKNEDALIMEHLRDSGGHIGNIPIDWLQLSNQATNALYRAGYRYVGDLEVASPEKLLQVRNFGQECAEETISALRQLHQVKRKQEQLEASQSSKTSVAAATLRLLEEIFFEWQDCNLSEIGIEISDQQINSLLRVLNDTLSPMEEMVLKLSFGLNCPEPLDEEQIEIMLNLSIDQVRDHKINAFLKLQNPQELGAIRALRQIFPELRNVNSEEVDLTTGLLDGLENY